MYYSKSFANVLLVSAVEGVQSLLNTRYFDSDVEPSVSVREVNMHYDTFCTVLGCTNTTDQYWDRVYV